MRNNKLSVYEIYVNVFLYLYCLGVPEAPRSCELRNESVMEVICQAGYDGGLQQHFILEAIGATSIYFNNLDSTRSTHEILDNEISTMNDQVSIVPLFVFLFSSSLAIYRLRDGYLPQSHLCIHLFIRTMCFFFLFYLSNLSFLLT